MNLFAFPVLVLLPAVLTSCFSVSSRKPPRQEAEWVPGRWFLEPLVTEIAMPALVAPDATMFNLPVFLDSDAFFLPNATRIFDAGDVPVPRGAETFYTQFPSEEPSVSPDQRWQ